MMTKAAKHILVILAAVAIGFAQTPSGSNSSPADQVPAEQAQNTQSVAEQSSGGSGSSGAGMIAAGTEIHATLDTPLSAKTSKPGDRFTATIADEVRGSDPTNGSVIIPGGARLEGEVAEAEASKAAALKGKGGLSLHFRDVVLPNGQTLPFTATLISVHDTKNHGAKKIDDSRMQPRGSDTNKGTAIGTGAAGLVFGGPVKGVAIGALAGGGYVLATNGKDVNLPAQTGMVIRLDQSISWNGISASIR